MDADMQSIQVQCRFPRVCLAIDNLNVGGSQVDLADLAKGLKKKGYPVFICCLRTGGALVKDVEEAGVKVIILGKKSRYDFRIIFRLARILRRERIDIIHSSLFTANFFARVAARIARTPVVIASDQSLGFRKGFLRTWIDRFLKYWTDIMISDSTIVGRLFIERDHFPPERVRVILNGIDLSKLNGPGWRESAREELGIKKDDLIVGTVARFTFEKGLIYFLEAMPRVISVYPDVRFLIVGDAELPQEEIYKKNILEKISALNLESKVILPGFRRDVGRMLAAMDIFISPSIVDNFPNTVMEAMGAGLPVVATRVGSITDAVVEGETGLLVRPGDAKALADAMFILIKDVSLRENMGREGRVRANQKFSRQRVVNEVAEVYQELWKRKGKSTEKELVSFSFGENWLDFIKDFDENRYQQAKQSMIDMLGPSLEGKTFVDIGCGSGIFSLAAIKLGAKYVLSIDVDPKSILACQKIKEVNKAENWQILQKSILDKKFLGECGKFDIVYSWGVLHHTGAMWQAIDNASNLVEEEGGIFAIAIYNRTITSPFWLWFKRLYNQQNSHFLKRLMVLFVFIPRLIIRILKMKNPLTVKRGMSLYYDAVDWAGGLPYEYASFEEVVSYMQKKGFELVVSTRTKKTGCNEFVFLKRRVK